jgi:hypothetical protein
MFEGLPGDWLKPGMKTGFKEVNTTFGKLSFDLVVNDAGDKATLELLLDPYANQKPEKIVIHQEAFNEEKEISLDWEERITIEIDIRS